MERYELSHREYEILHHLSCMPNKIASLHDQDNITEFVLHDLCCNKCFNLHKAAYFIDNPDFNCFKGIVGFLREEAFADSDAIWTSPAAFSLHMRQAAFNKAVRAMAKQSLKKTHTSDEEASSVIAQDLGFNNYKAYSWPLKHDNHALLIVERDGVMDDESIVEQHLKNGVTLLSFCPVF